MELLVGCHWCYRHYGGRSVNKFSVNSGKIELLRLWLEEMQRLLRVSRIFKIILNLHNSSWLNWGSNRVIYLLGVLKEGRRLGLLVQSGNLLNYRIVNLIYCMETLTKSYQQMSSAQDNSYNLLK